MELKDFVKETIVQIMHGVHAAKSGVKDLDGRVNPDTLEFRADSGQTRMWCVETDKVATELDFDIAVTTSESTEKGVDAGIKVLGVSLGIGGKASQSSDSQSVSRIKFSVPLVLP